MRKSRNPTTRDWMLRSKTLRLGRVEQNKSCAALKILRYIRRYVTVNSRCGNQPLSWKSLWIWKMKALRPASLTKWKLTSDVAQTVPEILDHPHLYTRIGQIVQEKARSKYVFGIDKLLNKAVEDALVFVLQTGYKQANGGLKNFSIYFSETVLIEMAHRGTL